jgi:hypothetical protein
MVFCSIVPDAERPSKLFTKTGSGHTYFPLRQGKLKQIKCHHVLFFFLQMITAWRTALQAPSLWFGFVQLSTWFALASNFSHLCPESWQILGFHSKDEVR